MNKPCIAWRSLAPSLSLLGLITIPIALLLGVFGSADCVAQQLKVIPEQLDFAGCIQAGMDTVARPLQLLNRSLTDSIRIDGVFINNKPTGFRATQKSRTFGAGTSTEIEVKFIPKVPGKYTDRLIIRWSLKGIEQVAVEVNLTGQAQMPWLFPVPSGPGAKQPVLDTVTLGDTTIRPLILRNPSNCFPFPITKLQLDDSNGQFFLANRGVLPRSIPPSGFDTILVGVVPRQTGRLVSNLRVNHPHDDRFEFDVWMDVVVVRSKFIIRPRELDFRDVAIGTTSQEQSIAITVLGADNKRFTSIQVVGDDAKDFHFTAPTLPYRLNRGTADSLTIGVECTPTTIGPRLAEIRLRTEDGDEFRIPLYAIGKDEGFMVRPLFVDAGNAAIGETVILGDTIQISKLRPPPASISQIRIDGPDAAMFAVTGSLPATFNQTTPAHRFTVQFTPTRLGHCGAYANFLLPDNSRIRVELHGDGVGASRSLAWVPSATNFGNVRVDSSRTLRFGLVNRGNTREQITTAAMEGAATGDFTIGQLDLPVTLRPFADTLWSDVRFTPTAVGSRTASLRATAASGTTTAVAIQGTGEIWNLTVTPSEVDFGDVTNGSSVTATNNIILTNTGTATIAITEARIEGDTAEAFTLQGETDVKLTQGQNATFSLSFAPNSTSSFAATVVITLSEGDPIRVPIRGRGVPRPAQIRLIHAPAEFGLVQANTISQPIRIGITNVGEAAATVRSVEFGSNPGNVFAAVLPAQNQGLSGFAADTLWIPITFAPVAATRYQSELLLDGFGGITQIQLSGEGTPNGVGADPITLDLGPVMTRTELEAKNALVVRNRTSSQSEVTNFHWIAGDTSDFTITGDFPVTVAPSGGEVFYSVKFLPNETRNYRAEGRFILRSGGEIPVTITGSGSLPPFVYLDTAYRKVNEKFDLRLYASASPGGVASSGGYVARIRFNPTSLLLADVTGRGVTWERRSAGVIELRSADPSAFGGAELARLTMEGLVTGKPENEVAIEEFTLLSAGTTLGTSPGKVFLDGCQIDQAGLFGKPAKIHKVFPSPVSSGATLRFTAPNGTQPVAVVVDPTGRDVATIPLPEGTGEETETTLTFDTVGSGFYFLELRLGTQRSVIPVMISR